MREKGQFSFRKGAVPVPLFSGDIGFGPHVTGLSFCLVFKDVPFFPAQTPNVSDLVLGLRSAREAGVPCCWGPLTWCPGGSVCLGTVVF